jgi:multisubunit Na+/H+ antiporter MnhB subunit
MFAVEAYVSLAVAVIVLILTRRSASVEPEQPVVPALNTDVLLVLGTLFCTVAGYFVIQPMMAAARAGQGGGLSFGALHGLSAGFFALKALLVLLLAWRLAAR